MASVSTYLNFDGTCLEAFEFYKRVFGTEYVADVMFMRDIPSGDDAAPLTEEEGGRVMHVALPILGGHQIMGTDILPSWGSTAVQGNTMYINLICDSQDQLRELYAGLADGAQRTQEPKAEFWGDLYAEVVDRFGIQWMFIAALDA